MVAVSVVLAECGRWWLLVLLVDRGTKTTHNLLHHDLGINLGGGTVEWLSLIH
jgi:hypothetical protein